MEIVTQASRVEHKEDEKLRIFSHRMLILKQICGAPTRLSNQMKYLFSFFRPEEIVIRLSLNRQRSAILGSIERLTHRKANFVVHV